MKFLDRLSLSWRIIRHKPGNLTTYADRELSIWDKNESDYGKAMSKSVKELVWVFSSHQHSGFSAGFAIAIAKDLMAFKPLTPLTGEEDEWTVVSEGCDDDTMVAQNNRYSTVFKRADGTAYDIDAVVFREPDGICFTGKDSRRDITFPYTPSTEYVDVPSWEDRQAAAEKGQENGA